MSHTVYLITNAVNGKVYVGQTVDPVRRFDQHKRGNASVFGLSADIRKYGPGCFSFEIIATTTEGLKRAREMEKFYANRLGAYDPVTGYNRRPSGGAGADNANAIAHGVCQYTKDGKLVATFRSIKQASEKTGIHRTAINRATNRNGYTAGGYSWEKQ